MISENIKKEKIELKTLAAEIRRHRFAYRQTQRDGVAYLKTPWEIECLSQEFRYRHVAYCMARGRAYEEIEQRVRDGNELDPNRLNRYKGLLDCGKVGGSCG